MSDELSPERAILAILARFRRAMSVREITEALLGQDYTWPGPKATKPTRSRVAGRLNALVEAGRVQRIEPTNIIGLTFRVIPARCSCGHLQTQHHGTSGTCLVEISAGSVCPCLAYTPTSTEVPAP